MFRTAVAALVFALVLTARPAQAADAEETVVAVAASVSPVQLASDTDWSLQPVPVGPSTAPSRGNLLPVLYVSLAGLNIFDAYTTRTGLSHGAVEANPLMHAVAGNSAALWAIKGGATAASIFFAERLWRQHRRAEAIAVMVVSNGVMAGVAARNASVLRHVQ
jgi:hypothetical protein